MSRSPPSERLLVFLIGAVQFVNVLDFVMVMPLGPWFASGLGIAPSEVGTIGAAYTAAACVAGVAGSAFLDRFDRRKALAVALVGLVAGTAAGGLAWDLPSLLAARLVAGAFGGPATALALSIVADLVPQERRGRALGAVMGAFSVASILGVPAALALAERAGWRAPFFAVGGLGLLVVAGAVALLPPVRAHLTQAGRAASPRIRDLLARGDVRQSYLMTAVVMAAGFVLIPVLPVFLERNLGSPREQLKLLYFAGGLVSFVTLRVAGKAVDRFGSFRVGTAGCALLVPLVWVLFVLAPAWLPVPLAFVAFMLGLGVRNVAYNTLTSRVPQNAVRARFMSLQSAVQHAASATGAFLSSRLLWDAAGGRLGGGGRLAGVSIALTLLVPVLLWRVERRVRLRAQAAAAAPAAEPGRGEARPRPSPAG